MNKLTPDILLMSAYDTGKPVRAYTQNRTTPSETRAKNKETVSSNLSMVIDGMFNGFSIFEWEEHTYDQIVKKIRYVYLL